MITRRTAQQIRDARSTRCAPEHWLLSPSDEPPLGAHLVTTRSGYTHHGIYVGGDKVVHYAGLSHGWRSGPVEEASICEFAHGQPIFVRDYAQPRFDRREVVARARARLGEDDYRIFSNNCEHLCRWCVRGESRSAQIDRWRRLPGRLLALIRAPLMTRAARRAAIRPDHAAWGV